MKNVRGFMLIELLIVIAIIAILSAILFPVFGKVRSTLMNGSTQMNLWTLDNSNFSGADLTNAEIVLGFSQNYYK